MTLVQPDGFGQSVGVQQPAVKAEPDAGRYRLTIEEGPGGFIYMTRDRVTGEVIRQLPREEVVKMSESPTYGAGELIKTKV